MAERKRRKSAARRKNSGPKRGPRFIIAVGVVILATAAAVIAAKSDFVAATVKSFSSREKPMVNSIEIENGVHVFEKAITAKGGISLPCTRPAFRRSYRAAVAAATPWVEKVKGVRFKDSTASVSVVERSPCAIVSAGGVRLVDRTGMCLPLDSGCHYDLPLVAGLRDTMIGKRLCLAAGEVERMNRVFDAVRAADEALMEALSQVRFGADGSVRIMVAGRPTVIVLDERDVQVGLQRLARLWPVVQNDTLPPLRIDLSYRDLAFVKEHTKSRI